MKKVLAALLVVAMVVSAFSMAFAANIACWKFAEPDSSRNKAQVTGLAAGDKVTFYVKPVADSQLENADMYVRTGGTKATYDTTGKDVYSGQSIAKNATKCSDGWYFIQCTIPADGDYDFFIDGGNMDGVNLGQSLIAGITVNGTAIDASRVQLATQDADIAEPTVVADDGGEAPAEQGGDETPATTGETKPAKTGIVSAAVIAAAAVLGGAVVLKKKEF